MRTPMVTRTFKTTVVNGLFVNVDSKETFEKSFILPRPFKTEQEIMKAVRKTQMFEGTEKLVSIISFENVNKRYSMSEETFVNNATQQD